MCGVVAVPSWVYRPHVQRVELKLRKGLQQGRAAGIKGEDSRDRKRKASMYGQRVEERMGIKVAPAYPVPYQSVTRGETILTLVPLLK